jgi:hypothetical protein
LGAAQFQNDRRISNKNPGLSKEPFRGGNQCIPQTVDLAFFLFGEEAVEGNFSG